MQWILQQFEDTEKLADALDRLGVQYTFHKVVPFVGELDPEPVIKDKDDVVLFGSYSLWRYTQKKGLSPGVFKIRPFVHEEAWHPHLLNGADALFLSLKDIPAKLPKEDRLWFIRPVDDSKADAGKVSSTSEIVELARKVLSLSEDEIPRGSLRHDTELMLTEPKVIQKEWRLWVVNDAVCTYSLYKEGSRVIYKPEIDDDVLHFAEHVIGLNPNYSPAYVMDVCRTEDGLKIIETNCINASGLYAADLIKLVNSIDNIMLNQRMMNDD